MRGRPMRQRAVLSKSCASRALLPFCELSYVLAEAKFDIGALLQAVFERLALSPLKRRPRGCLPECVQLGRKLLIGRQGDLVDEVFDIAKGLRIERRDSPHK